MTAKEIEDAFKKLKEAVTTFVDCSKACRTQVETDNTAASTALNQEDQDMFTTLESAEKELTSSVGGTSPKTIADMRKLFTKVNSHLTKAVFSYDYLVGVSQSPDAKNKEEEARESLEKLIKVVEEIRPQLLQFATDNLFLTVMKGLVGKGPRKIGNTTFPAVTEAEFKLTQRLFKLERFPLTEDQIIGQLIGSWETVIAYFVKYYTVPPKSKDPASDKAKVEAHFFTMHGLLELLYDQLEANKQTSDILSTAI